MSEPRTINHHGTVPKSQQTSPPVHNSDAKRETAFDVLTPLLESLMIDPSGESKVTGSQTRTEARLVPESHTTPRKELRPGVDEVQAGKVLSKEGCARCRVPWKSQQHSAQAPCCKSDLCAPCLRAGLDGSIGDSLWHNLGSTRWIRCLARACSALSTPQDILSIEKAPPFQALASRALDTAQQARSSLQDIHPRPARRECELAQRLHQALTDHKIMSTLTEAEIGKAFSITPLPVRSGFLTQPVPVLMSMFKTKATTCVSCSASFESVDISDEPAWRSVSSAFPGDWSWLVLGRPSKTVLAECAQKHSVDICPSCLPKLIFSGLEFTDAMSGAPNYRFACPLCKHTFSPVQVERLARIIAPNRSPVTLVGMSLSAGRSLDSSKPAEPPKAFPPLLGTSNGLKLPGGGLPKTSDSESAARKKALMEAVVSKKPNVKWDDVAGLTPAKHELQRAIMFPARFPNLYDEKRKASGAILLYGPPGTGKSYLAKAVATEVDHTLFSISAGDLVSKWMGESEKLVRQLFALAREHKPSIIFIDEIDALCSNREGSSGGGPNQGNEHTSRLKTELLVQLDGLHSGSTITTTGTTTSSSSCSSTNITTSNATTTTNDNNTNDPTPTPTDANTGIVILAATNLPWSLDPAFRRRFEPRIHIPLPDAAARRQLFVIHSGKWGRQVLSPTDLDELASLTVGYSGSDIANAVKHALGVPLRRVQVARWFKRVVVSGKESGGGGGRGGGGEGDGSGQAYMYTPCEAGEEGAVEMGWEQVPKNGLVEPPVTAEDFKQVLRERRVKSSVGSGELQRYEEWTREFGVEGGE